MSECPFCHRRLLSTASPACNWCGKEIPDAAYQQRAAAQREALSVQQALHDAAGLAAMEALNIGEFPMGGSWNSPFGILTGRPFPVRPALGRLSPVSPPLPVIPPAPAEEPAPEEAVGGRFRHLEL